MYRFGTSGLLYQSNKLMYDRTTNSLWEQFTGEPVVGPLADSGIKLKLLPVVVTTWDEWRTTHPDTTVVDIDTGIFPPRAYPAESHPDSIYYSYRQREDTMFPVATRSKMLRTKDQVLGLTFNGQATAYPLTKLLEERVVNDSVGGQDVVVAVAVGAGAARAYERGDNFFSAVPPDETYRTDFVLRDDQGRLWEVREGALVLRDDPDRQLKRLSSQMAYWFGWYSFYPTTKVFGEPDPAAR